MTALARWVALAFLGLAVAAAIALAASKVVSQPIGLSGQSFKAGDELAPPPRQRPQHPGPHFGHQPKPATTTTTIPPTTTGSIYPGTTTVPVTPVAPATTSTEPSAPAQSGSSPADPHDD